MADKLLAALTRLRSHQGMTIRRLAEVGLPELLDVSSPYEAQELILRTLGEMGKARHAEALRNSLTSNGKILSDRRRDFAAQWDDKSGGAVKKWEDEGFAELAMRLRAAKTSIIIPPKTDNQTSTYMTESLERESHYRAGSLVETTVTQTIVSLVDGLDRIPRRTKYDETPDDVEVGAATGCSIGLGRTADPRKWTFDVHLPKPLRSGERHRFRYRLHITGLPPCTEMTMTSSPTGLDGMKHVHLQVQFDSLRPREIWLLENVGYLDTRDGPGVHPPVELDAFGGVSATFSDPRPGFVCGLAWLWPTGM